MRLVHELVIRKGFPSCFQATEEKQGEAEAVKRKLRETAQSKLRNPPSQVSSPSACDNPNLPPGNASSLFQSPHKSQTKPSVDLSGPRTNSSMIFPSQMTQEQMAQLLQFQQNQLALLQMQYGQGNPGLPLFPQPIQPPMPKPVMAQPAANDPWKEKFDLMAARVKELEQKENERLARHGEEPRHETGSTLDPPPESVEPKPPTRAEI